MVTLEEGADCDGLPEAGASQPPPRLAQPPRTHPIRHPQHHNDTPSAQLLSGKRGNYWMEITDGDAAKTPSQIHMLLDLKRRQNYSAKKK